MRFYRFNLSTSADYESMRASVDAALGYSGGVTCIQPYASAPQDSKGRVLLSINPSTPGYSLLVLQLNALIAASKARELDQNWYEFSLEPIVTGGGGGGSSAWGDITGTPTTLAGYGITDAVGTSDSRLSDARTPVAHKATHATGGTDAIAPADIGAASASHAHGNITSAGAIGATSDQVVVTTASGVLTTAAIGSGLALSAGTLSATGSGAPMVEEEFTVSAGPSGYTGSGTSGSPYTRTLGVPTGAKMLLVQAVGAGGGGGGGYRRATGTIAGGGGGGGGAASLVRWADVRGLDGQTVTVQVGAGGAGGAGGATTDGTAGSAGTKGGDTIVRVGDTARYWLAVGGSGGGVGTSAAGAGGTNGANTEFPGVNGGASSTTATPTGVTRSSVNCVGGGGGGGCTAANAQFAGAAGTAPTSPLLYAGASSTATTGTNATAGAVGGGNGGAGAAAGGGAGGGGNATGAGGTGGAGGDYGGGGGGGGVGTGANGGSGGNGGAGFVRLAWMF